MKNRRPDMFFLTILVVIVRRMIVATMKFGASVAE